MNRSLRGAAHHARMRLRALRGRFGRRRVRGRDNVIDAAEAVLRNTGARINPAADVMIADHVWVGQRVLILKGSRIGRGSVVGAGSVVTGELPADTVSTGVPARPVRAGVTWKRERMALP